MKNISLLVFFVFSFLFFCYLGKGFKAEKTHPPENEVEQFSRSQVDLLRIHNEKRKSKGLVGLEISEELCMYAQMHSEEMSEKNSLFHSSMADLQKFSGAGLVGENIAWGQDDPESVVSSWMLSPMHRWNILGSSYRKVGFGVKEGKMGRKYWCAVFSN